MPSTFPCALPAALRIPSLLLSCSVLIGLSSCATPARREQLTAKPIPITELNFLAGAWITIDEDHISEETWMPPRGGTMSGVGRTVIANKTVFFEFLRITEEPTGTFYHASPNGKPPIRFTLIEATANSAVFENPNHDFPQRIRYERKGNSLHATISGTLEGKSKSSSWKWQRAAPQE